MGDNTIIPKVTTWQASQPGAPAATPNAIATGRQTGVIPNNNAPAGTGGTLAPTTPGPYSGGTSGGSLTSGVAQTAITGAAAFAGGAAGGFIGAGSMLALDRAWQNRQNGGGFSGNSNVGSGGAADSNTNTNTGSNTITNNNNGAGGGGASITNTNNNGPYAGGTYAGGTGNTAGAAAPGGDSTLPPTPGSGMTTVGTYTNSGTATGTAAAPAAPAGTAYSGQTGAGNTAATQFRNVPTGNLGVGANADPRDVLLSSYNNTFNTLNSYARGTGATAADVAGAANQYRDLTRAISPPSTGITAAQSVVDSRLASLAPGNAQQLWNAVDDLGRQNGTTAYKAQQQTAGKFGTQ